jgi:lipopolysaccharide biosynthesis glycosyltransferase
MATGPIKIFVGTEIKTKVPLDVLSYSIKRRTSHEVSIVPMIGSGWEVPKGLHQGTGFSLRRFMIPNACNYEGHAIYLDADQLCLGDISELWGYADKLVGKAVACTYQPDKFSKTPWPNTSVMLIDCHNAGWNPAELWDMLRRGYNYPNFMHLTFMDSMPLMIPTFWNHLNVHEDATTRILHYTKEPEQPWYKPSHSLASLWERELVQAISAGAVSKKDFEFALDLWHKPKLDKRLTQGLHPHYKKYLGNF